MKKIEFRDLFISIIVISVLFALSDLSIETLFFSIIVTGIAFLCHDFAHRETAMSIGSSAEYRIWPTGLLVAIILGIVSGGRLIFAAIGSIYINPVKHARWKSRYPSMNPEEYGLISSMGPLANMGMSLFFLAFNFIYPTKFFVMGASINIFIAFFNLMPFPPFDGSKVIIWDRKTWLLLFIPALIGFVGTFFL